LTLKVGFLVVAGNSRIADGGKVGIAQSQELCGVLEPRSTLGFPVGQEFSGRFPLA